MELTELIHRTGAFVAFPAVLAFLLLIPLYFSQRRDIERLRAWMAHEPDYAVTDLRASETRLDRADAELARLAAQTAPTMVQAPPSAAERVTSERPALARITMERAALEPHPRWRRFAERATRPRVLTAIAAATVLAGALAVVGSQELLRDGGERGGGVEGFDRSAVTVSVLNGTEFGGLAGKVQSDVAANGYEVDALAATESTFERTVVMFRAGERPAARMVARDLGVPSSDIQQIDPTTARLAGEVPVVVIAGEDRAR
jgi:hypothetical protein